MFPVEFPLRAFRNVPKAKRIVDPFCGRGTTLYAARATGRKSFGIDCSAVAVAISRAKLAIAKEADVLELARSLIDSGQVATRPDGEFWSRAYQADVLQAICRIRKGLIDDGDSQEATILRAVMMGILHGPTTKVGSYLSNQMQRTFAPKPSYAVEYWSERGLQPPAVDVYAAIERKVRNVFRTTAFDRLDSQLGEVVQGDSSDSDSWAKCDFKIDMVVTSPPYYGMRTYVPDQWLRNWFVGGPPNVDYNSNGRIPSSSPDEFASGLGDVWDNMAVRAGERLDMFIRFGSLPSRKIEARELLDLSFELSENSWKRVYTQSAATANSGRRQANQMRHVADPESEFDMHVRLK